MLNIDLRFTLPGVFVDTKTVWGEMMTVTKAKGVVSGLQAAEVSCIIRNAGLFLDKVQCEGLHML